MQILVWRSRLRVNAGYQIPFFTQTKGSIKLTLLHGGMPKIDV